MARYKPIRSAIHNFAHSFCSTLNYVGDDYGIEHVTKAARSAGASRVVVRWVRDGVVLDPVVVEPSAVLNSRVRRTLTKYANWLPALLRSMDSDVALLRSVVMRLDFDWSMPRPFGPLRLTMEAEDDRGREYVVPVTDFIQPAVAAEPAAVGRRWASGFLRWFGLGVYVALATVLPSAPRG